MGKRELLLIVAFMCAGTLLYQATAPPSPDSGGFSVRGMIENLRRHVGPRHEYLADERTEALPFTAETKEVRIAGVHSLKVDGTDDRHASAKIQIYSTGTDEQAARALGKRTVLKSASSGDILSLEFDYPPEERQRTMMTLTVPRDMRIRVRRSNSLEATGVDGVEFDDTRGEATLSGITGSVRGSHTGGEMMLENVNEIDMTARRSDITIKNASGTVRLDLTGGALNGRDLAGRVNLHANRTSIELEGVTEAFVADLAQGTLEVTRLSGETRIDARGTEVRVELDQPAPLTAITTGENISVRLPDQTGFELDATAEDGEIRVPPGAPQASTAGPVSRARGPINGGGPTLALRTSHGDIVIR